MRIQRNISIAIGIAAATAMGYSSSANCAGTCVRPQSDRCDKVKFEEHFSDSTLRLDYIMSGNSDLTRVSLRRKLKTPGWAGRRTNLNRVPYIGNGQITLTDVQTGDTIFRNSFSTLYQEWLGTPEAHEAEHAYENTYIVPLPRRDTKVTVTLLNPRHEAIASNSFIYSPTDILTAEADTRHVPEHAYLHRGGDTSEAIDVVIMAEGYTAREMDKFMEDARTAADAILSYEPFRSHASDFNFIVVKTPSEDSGVSIPSKKEWKNTSFGSNFDTFYSKRYLTCGNVHLIHDTLAGIPYEHIIILANSPTYGGGGVFNAFTLTTTGHEKFRPVVVHEFGHSFGGLADEYFYENDVFSDTYPLDVEPWEPNITTLVDFSDKWREILPEGTPIPTPKGDKDVPGVYEGAAYAFKGIFRPNDQCRMRNNDYPTFCPGCRLALERLIEFYTAEAK